MSTAITKLRQCSETVQMVSDTLAAILNEQGHEKEAEPIALEERPRRTGCKILAGPHRSGASADSQACGVEKLSQVDPAHYADLLAEAEAL